MTETLPALLAARAAERGEDPWLFFRREGHWRWLSWGQAADQVARGAAALREAGAAGPLAFAARPAVAALTADLAARAAGLAGLALAESPAELPPQTRWAEVAEAGSALSPPAGLAIVELPGPRSRLEHWHPETWVSSPATADALERSEDGTLSAVPEGEVLAAAGRLQAALPEVGPRRPIALAGVGLERRAGRVALAWSLIAGAALALPAGPADFLADALWARPQVVLADDGDLALLAHALGEPLHRRRHRLRAVVVTGGEAAAAGAATWEALGVGLLAL